MKNMYMGIVYLFHQLFIILKIKVAIIGCSWSKAPSRAAENNGPMVLIRTKLGAAWPEWGQKKLKQVPQELIWGSLTDDMFSLWVRVMACCQGPFY